MAAFALLYSLALKKLTEKFLCTSQIDEPILGFDFLKKHQCSWLFASSELLVNAECIPLRKRAGPSQVRRIYVGESVEIPAETSMNIPVRLPYSDLYSPATDWVTEAKTLRPGVYLARTLLPESQTAAICAINASGQDQRLKDGLFLGQAVPGVCTSDSIAVDVLSKQNQRGDVTEGS